MKIPSLVYLCFWGILSVSALTSVRFFLKKVEQFRNHYSQLEPLLHSFLCFSLSHAFLFNPSLSAPRNYSGRSLPIWCYVYLNLMLSCSIVYTLRDSSLNWVIISGIALLMQSFFMLALYAVNWYLDSETVSMHFFHWFAWIVLTALTIIIHQDHTIEIEFSNPFLPYVVGPSLAYVLFLYQSKFEYPVCIELPASIKIIAGLTGNILANHFLKDKSILVFWMVVSLAVFCLGNISMMQSTCQAGIFAFLVGVTVDVGGDIFGLDIYIWVVLLIYAVLLFLFKFLDKIKLQYPGADDPEMQMELSRRGQMPSREQEPEKMARREQITTRLLDLTDMGLGLNLVKILA